MYQPSHRRINARVAALLRRYRKTLRAGTISRLLGISTTTLIEAGIRDRVGLFFVYFFRGRCYFAPLRRYKDDWEEWESWDREEWDDLP
ncbi:MAG: hypothetical protein QXT02_05410 [Candidatus Hadarchaeum sp.]|uniref:hypothetical protein n=1 Tax=Candidatus Hadarchaeum sp. TaxID=2883567 RepID=UPI00317D7B2A